ncbi:MAG: SpoIIIAH-like family protein [Bacillota bacterium]
MTIITSRRTVFVVLIVLALVFLYLSFEEGKKLKNESAADSLVGLEVGGEEFSLEAEGSYEIENDQFEDFDENNFFMEYRLKRDRQRAQEIEMLQTMFNSASVADEVRQEALHKVLQLTNSLDQELTLETLIIAKGYEDAVTFIQENQVTVVVKDDGFDNKDAVKIADLVHRTTGIPLSKITIFAKS